MMVTTGPHTHASTLIQKQFRGQAATPIHPSFITPSPTVTASYVHRTKITACSHVLCAQSDKEQFPKLLELKAIGLKILFALPPGAVTKFNAIIVIRMVQIGHY